MNGPYDKTMAKRKQDIDGQKPKKRAVETPSARRVLNTRKSGVVKKAPKKAAESSINNPAKTRAKRVLTYSDINVAEWRDYDHIETGSLWQIDSRERANGHQLDYHGNCVPQILTQLLTRYTKKEDVVLDLFLGSGTSAIEAVNLGRRAIGVELKEDMAAYVENKLKEQGKSSDTNVICGDSGNLKQTQSAIFKALKPWQKDYVQFSFLHPPYADIIKFSDKKACLSNAPDTESFLTMWQNVCQQAYDCLEPGRFAAVVIGDKYTGGELIPLGFYCMEKMNKVGFKTKSIIVKNISGNEKAKGRQENLWRYRALAGGFYIFKHEYVIVFQKPKTAKKK